MRIPLESLSMRILMGREYIISIDSSQSIDWETQYLLYRQNALSLPESLALLYPIHYESKNNSQSIRGPRGFPGERSLSSMKCQANDIWGYPCPLDSTRISVVADHVFPYSLGGPTNSDNKTYLCEFHNQLKGNDIHFFPWEKGEPTWLKTTLNRIQVLRKNTY